MKQDGNKKMTDRKKMVAGLLAGLLFLVLAGSYWQQYSLQRGIASKIMRFHVLANSDVEEDQKLKLKVRDAVGTYLAADLAEVSSLEECEIILKEKQEQIIEVAEAAIAKEGYSYTVQAQVTQTKFPVKTYGEYTFPAGEYEALEITIGAGEGHNWWCVLYPNMCFRGSVYEVVEEEAKESLQEVLSAKEYQEVFDQGEYEVRFKIIDEWKKLRDWLR